MAGPNMQKVLEAVTPSVTEQMNNILTAEYTTEEINMALDDMGDLKAPSADGMPAIFYKKF
jgi:predicted component of type VI protein secretion system